MTSSAVTSHVLGSAWPLHFNKPVAEAVYENIKQVGLPRVECGQTPGAGKGRVQRNLKVPDHGLETKLKPLKGPVAEEQRIQGGSDDIGDVAWNVPTITLEYPSNIPQLAGPSLGRLDRHGHADRPQRRHGRSEGAGDSDGATC